MSYEGSDLDNGVSQERTDPENKETSVFDNGRSLQAVHQEGEGASNLDNSVSQETVHPESEETSSDSDNSVSQETVHHESEETSSGFDLGEPLQIIRIEEVEEEDEVRHKLELNDENLQMIMSQPAVKDNPVVILSVTGDARKGKSFLLGFFLKYLEAKKGTNWLDKDEMIKGFEWRGGCEPVTSGIQIWSKPIMRVNESGETEAVLLMDTQGMFDSESTMEDWFGIFVLSYFLSSVQIYNLKNQIQENDLEHVQIFAGFKNIVGKMLEDKGLDKPRLVFLIRDWDYLCSHTFGREGGDAYVKEKLQINRKQTKEQKKRRENITSYYSGIEGFLLPHPGFAVATHSGFNGYVREIDDGFVKHVQEFVPYIVSKLVTKTMGCTKMNGENCQQFIKVIVETLQKEGNRIPDSFSSVLTTFLNDNNIEAATKNYADKMAKFVKSYKWYHHLVSFPKTFLDHHNKFKTEALAMFYNMPTMSELDELEKSRMKEKFDEKIQEKYNFFESDFKEKGRKVANARNAVGCLVYSASGIPQAIPTFADLFFK